MNALRTPAGLLAAMAVAVLAVAAIAFVDARQEAARALGEFAEQQAALADGLAQGMTSRRAIDRVERPGRLVLLFTTADGALVRADGAPIDLPPVTEALARHERWARLSREQSAALGLPARTSIAGLAPIVSGDPEWRALAVVATAQEERDREIRAQQRAVAGVAIAAALSLAFGGLALRMQRKELTLARELAVAEAQSARDERLVRADKLATMGALATGIAHEVSTPLGVIVGRAEQLRPKVESDEKALRAVDAILEQGERIGRVIRGFLSLARGESPAFETVDPASIARASVDLVEHRFAKAQVALRADVAPGLPAVTGEPRLLEQAVVNLLLNACDACDPGGNVKLDVTRDDDRVAFVVTDDGKGIAPESAARALEPFFTTKPAGKGTGLGLAITSEIVKHHRGTLAIEPRAGAHGTRARIALPAARSEAA